MKKNIFYRLFRLGAIPARALAELEKEEIVVSDEGISGWFKARNVRGPGKRYIHKTEGFSGWLAVTKKRLVCFSFWKRQINISVDDPRISLLFVDVPDGQTLSISFESSHFRKGWKGVIEFRFKTEKALQFHSLMRSMGAQQGTSKDAQHAS